MRVRSSRLARPCCNHVMWRSPSASLRAPTPLRRASIDDREFVLFAARRWIKFIAGEAFNFGVAARDASPGHECENNRFGTMTEFWALIIGSRVKIVRLSWYRTFCMRSPPSWQKTHERAAVSGLEDSSSAHSASVLMCRSSKAFRPGLSASGPALRRKCQRRERLEHVVPVAFRARVEAGG